MTETPAATDSAAAMAMLMSPQFLDNPYPAYAQLRAADPVHFIAPMNAWLLTRFADVKTAFSDDRFRVVYDQYQINRVGPAAVDHDYFKVGKEFLVCNDPPVHTRLRRIFRAPFTNKRVEELLTTLRRLAEESIDSFIHEGRTDIIERYSARVPLAVMGALLAVPPDDEATILSWVSAFYHILEIGPLSPDQLVAADDASRRARAYFGGLIEERRRRPGADFVSSVLAANAIDEDPMSDEQIVANLFLLYFAGHDTQKLQFGNMLAALDRNPAALHELAADPAQIEARIPELYRYDTVGQFMGRTVVEDVELGGKLIRAGQTVMVCMGAANRDPEAFPDPDRLDLHRAKALDSGMRHISFGAGRHHCLGAVMAQANLPLLLEVLLRRIPTLRVDWDGAVRHPSIATRGYDVLPITWG
ncbi:MAG: cytochrome P450 [Panacagrimonas sp.]